MEQLVLFQIRFSANILIRQTAHEANPSDRHHSTIQSPRRTHQTDKPSAQKFKKLARQFFQAVLSDSGTMNDQTKLIEQLAVLFIQAFELDLSFGPIRQLFRPAFRISLSDSLDRQTHETYFPSNVCTLQHRASNVTCKSRLRWIIIYGVA